VDRALVDYGMPMGPLELVDEVGVDVGEKVLHILHEAFGARMEPCPVAERVVKAGRLGKKSGKGIYVYEGDGERKQRKLNPEIYSILGVKPKSGFASDTIVDRCILPMVNEAARCLAENVVASPADCDLGMIMGTGFPPFRGGLLRYADSRGLKNISETLSKLSQSVSPRFAPSEPLLNLVNSGKSFYKE
jgi:3-hydroxyacyl-CoA dehydrogenase/enoyl-CoA hydratase/3-hydroxybutyryl-CoA epimerase